MEDRVEQYWRPLIGELREYYKKYPDADFNDLSGYIVGYFERPQTKRQIREAILASKPEKMVNVDIPEVDHTGKVIKVHRGETYKREMLFFNQALDQWEQKIKELLR